jgi:hypothetical protein
MKRDTLDVRISAQDCSVARERFCVNSPRLPATFSTSRACGFPDDFAKRQSKSILRENTVAFLVADWVDYRTGSKYTATCYRMDAVLRFM